MANIRKLLNNNKRTNDWVTPKEYTDALGDFLLDPCASVNQNWNHAQINWTIKDDGLSKGWRGRVWLNPPYSDNKIWMKIMADHGVGIALVPARTDTKWFQDYVFDGARAILFLKGRIKFYGSEGCAKCSCTFPVCFVAYSRADSDILEGVNYHNALFAGRLIVL